MSPSGLGCNQLYELEYRKLTSYSTLHIHTPSIYLTDMADPIERLYKYEDLRYQDSIRAIELLPGVSGAPLVCKLHEVRKSEIPDFEALSYVWENQYFRNRSERRGRIQSYASRKPSSTDFSSYASSLQAACSGLMRSAHVLIDPESNTS